MKQLQLGGMAITYLRMAQVVPSHYNSYILGALIFIGLQMLIIIVLWRNITERKRMEKELALHQEQLEELVRERTAELTQANARLRHSEERLTLAIVGTGGALWDENLDPHASFEEQSGPIYHSPEAEELLGYGNGDGLDPSHEAWHEHILVEDRAGVEQRQRDHFEGLTDYLDHEYRVWHKDGSIRWIRGRSRIIRDEQGRPIRWIGIDWDVTERKQTEEELNKHREHLEELVEERTVELHRINKELEQEITERVRAEEALRQSEEHYRTLFDHLPIPVFTKNRQGTYTSCNTENQKYWSENPIGQTDAELLDPDTAAALREADLQVMESGEVLTVEEHLPGTPLGARQVISRKVPLRDGNGNVIGILGASLDITERKRLEEEHVRQERLAAVGQLATGIAHDFNNMLTTVIGHAELLQLDPKLTSSARADLAKIVKQSQRAARLIRQILDFARQAVNEPQPLNLKAFLGETLKFIERTIPETIQVRFNFEKGDYTINADPVQLQQVITNLAVNARDAMTGGGALGFSLARITFGPDDPLPCSTMKSGEWVKLTVTDTGSGIAPEVLPHIFEPFFTTKGVGQGAGLGLAQVYGIIMQHGGCITVESQPGQSTTFTLYFPALSTQIVSAREAAEDTPRGEGETILLVEDEQVVLEVVQSMLERLNYRVLTARQGLEALATYRAQADRIRLVLTDAVMPDMDGFALASALQAEAPAIPVLLISGYSRSPEGGPETTKNITARLQKPFNLYQLARLLQEALGSS